MVLIRILGQGRAGGSLGLALVRVGWTVEFVHHGDTSNDAAHGVGMLVIATPDAAIAHTAQAIEPNPACEVLHLSGSLGLSVLLPHERRGSLHPLVSLPYPDIGADRLIGAWMAVQGPAARAIAKALHARTFDVDEHQRDLYHATAVVASNHLVALIGQVERLAQQLGVPLEAFLALANGSLQNARDLGAHDALTGPASRGDWSTVARHLVALPSDERDLYRALARAASRLADRPFPPDLDR